MEEKDQVHELIALKMESEQLRKTLGGIKRAIEGNGRPGLVQDVATTIEKVSNMEKRLDSTVAKIENYQKLVISSLLGALVSLGVAVAAMLMSGGG